ncbi:LysR family transcriptional regulator [Bradyrhizobium betae]|uniref:HTH lysR-type domain-containing protein n=1 Tax=Bradyrhizobium betae TaxID=244734 RepID=A0A4Q1VUZ8_9BRAD|nr:LysR family transcriptional regulator [Bradyrhizobium betae]RXT54257.1 hypothetical protein B5V03_02115 [Bradyrhizobium betae]
MVTLRHMQAFLAVVRTGSFTRAADLMSITQPVVSGLVTNLEQEVGFRLLDRSTRRVELSDAAAEFLEDSQLLVRNFEDAVRRARDVGAGRRAHLRVGAPPLLATILLPRAMQLFMERSADLAVTLIDRSMVVLYEMVLEGELNLAIGSFEGSDPAIARIPLVSDQLSVLCRKEHPLAHVRKPQWKDLAGFPIVTLPKGNGIRQKTEQGYMLANVEMVVAYELEQLATVIAMVDAGFGISVVPPYALSCLPSQNLAHRPLTAPVVTRSMEIIRRRDRALSPATEEFINCLRSLAPQLSRRTVADAASGEPVD